MNDASFLDKQYVVPDFVIKYPGNKYKLVELEKPGKAVATAQGQPRSEITQTASQIAEWTRFIKLYGYTLENDYSGIQMSYTTMIVISRDSEENFKGKDLTEHMQYVNEVYADKEVITYDLLISRAKASYYRLSTLSPAAPDINISNS